MPTESTSPLFESFIAAFTQRRPETLTLDVGKGFASIPEVSPAFGGIDIQDDGSELTMIVGRFTHCHFEMFQEDGDEASQRAVAVSEAIQFVEVVTWTGRVYDREWNEVLSR